ncbi:uncharacterized protein LOC114303860, partial [Camellia sinensis]|uniref:uncharacterized protein LOC114303860 n=1 Tax=Camellia sinensis TaxID=4442 RepID=UPI001035E17E
MEFYFLHFSLVFFFLFFCFFCSPLTACLFMITTEDDSEDELEDELPVIAADSGKSKSQAKHEKPPAAESANTAKPVAVGSKQKVKIVEPKKDVKTVEEIGSSDDDFETDSSEYASESDEVIFSQNYHCSFPSVQLSNFKFDP